MTQEEKQLLLKDLCARSPYEVKGRVYAETTKGEYDINGDMIFYDSPFDVTLDTVNTSTEEIHVIAIGNEDTVDFMEEQQTDGKPYTIDEFKPYLRPLSSMTEEEKKYISERCGFSIAGPIRNESALIMPVLSADWLIDFYNERHFDYRGLIPMGLALEAHDGMYENFLKTE